jgi:hypothetical protein
LKRDSIQTGTSPIYLAVVFLSFVACAQEDGTVDPLTLVFPSDSAPSETTDSASETVSNEDASSADAVDGTNLDSVAVPDDGDDVEGLDSEGGDSEGGDSEGGDADTLSDATDASLDTSGSEQACSGEADQAQLASWAEAAIYKWVMETAQECFKLVGGRPGALIEDEEFHACVAYAVSTNLEVSGACSLCFGGLAVCSKNFCLAACGGADPDIEENLQGCIDCQVENYCTHVFDECAGINSDD